MRALSSVSFSIAGMAVPDPVRRRRGRGRRDGGIGAVVRQTEAILAIVTLVQAVAEMPPGRHRRRLMLKAGRMVARLETSPATQP